MSEDHAKMAGASTDDLVTGESSSNSRDSLQERETWDNKAQYILAVVGWVAFKNVF
jgi:hypothetical protein